MFILKIWKNISMILFFCVFIKKNIYSIAGAKSLTCKESVR